MFTFARHSVYHNRRPVSILNFIVGGIILQSLDKKKAKIISNIFFLIVVSLMVLMAVMVGEKEVIFPEVGAISAGMFLTPHRSWMTDNRKIFAYLLICGIGGMLIVRFVPLPYAVQLILSYTLALLIQSVSGTSFMPMISAMVLPVLLHTRSLWYIISLLIFSALIIVLRMILEKAGVKRADEYIPVKRTISPGLTAFRIIVSGIMICIAVGSGFRFLAAPPLLVAFTELSAHKNKVIRLHPYRIIILMALSSASGSFVRLVFSGLPGIFTVAAVFLSSVLFMIIFENMGPMVPPAGAVMLLSYLIPEKDLLLYPLQILAGISFYVLISVLKQNRNDNR